jgi:hypothetical protein
MKKSLIIVVLALMTSMAKAQTDEDKQTDRLEASSMLKYRRGVEYIKNTIETFRYEGNLEAKEWLTEAHQPKLSSEATTEDEQKERRRIWDAYYEKKDRIYDTCPEHDYLFVVLPPNEGPIALTYDVKDTALVLLKCYDVHPNYPTLGKSEVKSFKMKVDVAAYDSIQRLHLLAVYTAVHMNPKANASLIDTYVVRNPNMPIPIMPSFFDHRTMSFHFVWGQQTGDLYARSHNSESPTAKKLIETFYGICGSVAHQDHEGLRSLMPTVNELLTRYRALILPDVLVDEWTDERFRQIYQRTITNELRLRLRQTSH